MFLFLQLVSQHGAEAERHLFRCLFSHIDFSGGDGKSSGKDQYQVSILSVDLNINKKISWDMKQKYLNMLFFIFKKEIKTGVQCINIR